SLHTMVRATVEAGGNLHQLVRNLNNYLCSYLPEHSFVTMVIVIVNTSTGELEIVNAGHPPPFAIGAKGHLRELQSEENVALGMIDAEFEVQRSMLIGDEVVLLYTDGLTELTDENQEALGVERLGSGLSRIVRDEPRGNVDLYRERVSQLLDGFRGSQLAADDSTYLIARRPRLKGGGDAYTH
ncbi:MAG: serine/threonine-protein phosphatase, partial [Polyangiaceae bacterium]|nr:serine/threonine-protein phosphatase [Polyangiaceae bacterium]